MNLDILNKIPELNQEAILEIEPLAPLSITSELPGSYYKTLTSPSKKMLCGLIENILGWHFDLADRKEILKELKKVRKKQKLSIPEVSGSTYIPLLIEYFDIKLSMLPEVIHYDDYWNKAYRRGDAIVHAKGTINMSYELIPEKRKLKRNDKKPNQVDDKALEVFFLNSKDKYPLYYSTPTGREYIKLAGNYRFKIFMDSILFKAVNSALRVNNLCYLGNSEGWVNLNLKNL